jgi:hypothetical protein
MKRIDGQDRALNLFGAGKDGFREQVPGVSQATQLTAKWFNQVQESLVRLIEGAGIALSEADFDQFTAAVQWHANTAAAQQIAVVVGAAPETLDQIAELAAAIGEDPNFAVTTATALAGKERKFDAGTRMLFQQTAAPVGWTKVTTHDNKALRVVSGAAGSGGSIDFTAAFVNGNVGATGLSIAQMPTHNHTLSNIDGNDSSAGTGFLVSASGGSGSGTITPNATISDTGGGQTHTHSINLDVKYVDIIIASKD